MAHLIMSSVPAVESGRFTLGLGCLNGWRLSVVARSAEFFVGDIPGLPDAPPDFAKDDERAIVDRMPSWTATFEPESATFADEGDL
jgi:hypothetical protein